MEYRELGRTGIKVSVIALGCEGFVANEGVLTEQLLNAAEKAASTVLICMRRSRKCAAVWVNGCVAAAVNLFYRHIYVRFGRRDSISGPGRLGK